MNDVMPIQLSTSVENVILLLNKMEVMFVKPFVIFFAVDGLIATDVMSFQWPKRYFKAVTMIYNDHFHMSV